MHNVKWNLNMNLYYLRKLKCIEGTHVRRPPHGCYGTALDLIFHIPISPFKWKTSSTLGKDTIKIHLRQNTPLPLLYRQPLCGKWGQGDFSLMHFKANTWQRPCDGGNGKRGTVCTPVIAPKPSCFTLSWICCLVEQRLIALLGRNGLSLSTFSGK